MFKDLEERASRDVTTRNETLKAEEFMWERKRDDYFLVMSKKKRQLVRFFLTEQNVIDISGEGLNVKCQATITFTNAGDCLFKVNGNELHPWQVLRMALEDLFFTE